jgi:uncharacterized protein (DUF433 family)
MLQIVQSRSVQVVLVHSPRVCCASPGIQAGRVAVTDIADQLELGLARRVSRQLT